MSFLRLSLALIVLGVLLAAPSVTIGLATDDHPHRAFLLSHLAGEAPGSAWDMFGAPATGKLEDHALAIRIGALPWWASPNLSMALLRPLAVATHYVDYALWPDSPALMHVHNLAWYAGLLAAVAFLYRRTLSTVAIASLALLLYVVDEAHVESAAWIAGRNTLMTAFFAVLAIASHHQAWATRKARYVWFTPFTLACALLSSEGGVAALLYLLAHALFMDDRPWRQRLLALAPAVGVAVIWRIAYRTLGYGMRGSAVYVDPSQPQRFLEILPERFALAVRDQFLLPPGWLAEQPLSDIARLHGLAAVLFLLVAFAALPHLRRSRTLRFYLAGALLSALPISAVGSAPRLLLLTGVGGCAFVSELCVRIYRDMRSAHGALPFRLTSGVAALGLLVLHVPVALALTFHGAMAPLRYEHVMASSAQSFPWGPALWGRHLYILNTPNYFVTAAAPHYKQGIGPVSLHTLSASTRTVHLLRRTEDSFEMWTEGGFLAEPWSTMVRSPSERFHVGYSRHVGPLQVEVVALMQDGRPARLRVSGPALGSGAYAFIYWSDERQRYEPLKLPTPGRGITLPGIPPAAP